MTHPKTPQAMYDELVAAIVKAVPAKQRTYLGSYWPDEETTEYTLEDVLLAMWHGEDMKYVTLKPHRKKGCALIHFEIPEATGAILGLSNAQMRTSFGEWHLGHDLSWHRDNAPETIAFLHSLLCR